MTTTKIWYSPAGTSSATFDVPGASDDPTKTVNLTNFVRQENNRYRWQFTANGSAQANVSATNWPVAGNTTITSYTFPGGGTIPANQGQILINGRWELAWNLIASNDNVARQLWTFQSRNHIGGNVQETVDSITSPQVRPKTAYSPYAEYYITGANVTGGSANTIQNVKFFANTSIGAVKYSGSGDPSGTWDVSTAFVYTTQRRWEVNLHSTGSTITSDHELSALGGILQSAASQLVIDSDLSSTAQNLTGFRFTDTDGDGVYTGTIDGGQYMEPGYIDTGYFTDSGIAVSFTPDRPLHQEYTSDLDAATTAKVIKTIAATIDSDIEAAGTAQNNIKATAAESADLVITVEAESRPSIKATATIEIDSTIADTIPGLAPGGTVTIAAELATDFSAQNRVFTLAQDYVDPDYADTGYFEQSSSATNTFVTEIESAVQADSSIIHQDGSITLEADLDTTVVAGFEISAGVILASQAELELAPYITGGAGVIRAAAADLVSELSIGDLYLGQSILLQANLESDSAAEAFAAIQRGIQDQLEIASELAADAISAPPILGSAELAIDSSAGVIPSLYPGFASPSQLETGPSTLEALAGYTLYGNFDVVQGITADFVVAGSTFRIDDYFTAAVESETRRLQIARATNQITVDPETRVNTIQVETRGLLVEPETRIDRIAVNPATLEGNRLRRYNQ